MKKNIKKLLCAALFLSISSSALPADGWQIPLISKLADYSKTRYAALAICTMWTAASLAKTYKWYSPDSDANLPPEIRKNGILINAGMATVFGGVGLAIYVWPHLKALYS
ncbi:hypothetical protein HYX58_04835 [Candidatus Dependentiae bacterium]|nr:hypothetical protein [Candidatus Dependentiae bacterium]